MNTTTIVVSGRQNSGKTTWVCALIGCLEKRGFRVGTVKHTHHQYAVAGKDSTRHQDAGASRVLLVSPHGAARYDAWENSEPGLLDLVDSHFAGFDIVLAEGYRGEPLPKIVVGEDPDADVRYLVARVPPVDGNPPDPQILERVADAIIARTTLVLAASAE